MCVCVCVCVCACMCVRVNVCACECVCEYIFSYTFHRLHACTYVCICREGDRARMYRRHINFERHSRKNVYASILTQEKHKTTETHKLPDKPKVTPGGIFLFEECVCLGRSTCAEQLTKRFCVSICLLYQ